MKSFILKTVFFFLLIVISVSFTFLLTREFSKKISLQIPSNVNKIVLGDSRAFWGIDDSCLVNTRNFARKGDNYLYSYAKLRELKKLHHQIDTVIFTYHYLGLSGKMNEWYFSDNYINEKLINYSVLLNYSEFELFLKNNLLGVLHIIPSIFQREFQLFFNYLNDELKNENRMGYYEKLERFDLDKSKKTFWKKCKGFEGESLLQKNYLIKIKNFCIENNIELILVQTPVHPFFYTVCDMDDLKDTYWGFKKIELSEFNLIDLDKMVLPDSLYGDVVHLNHRGAKLFTKELELRMLKLKQ